ncbi:alpha/beta hydrolase [Paenibacillus sacheonensis]|uniref:Carboxylesterase n=1 Tax=Paenibacillus sacheonensis TaxID=742054 RepID=A0A7X4YUW9_9BACL|nr:alpha/beta hydrolase [Paenibacillus sacheonensis]MBM7569151.1 phospholipase/carboxylesterase [Paenibacillus sacheonensis]NBC72985.1 carboxylesterase [Paenibacillus sacheonensis]
MKHIYQAGSDPDAPVLLLLHGTGGTEKDLLPLAPLIDAGASVLSVRGNVSENGMTRFFRRISEGIFDEEDLKFRSRELNEYLDEAAGMYSFDRRKVIAVGYSNGANIAASLLFHFNHSLMGAILHHPMVPLRGIRLPDLTGIPVFIGAGTNDPICSSLETEELSSLLEGGGAGVKVHWEHSGHQLTMAEVQAAAAWYNDTFHAMRRQDGLD